MRVYIEKLTGFATQWGTERRCLGLYGSEPMLGTSVRAYVERIIESKGFRSAGTFAGPDLFKEPDLLMDQLRNQSLFSQKQYFTIVQAGERFQPLLAEVLSMASPDFFFIVEAYSLASKGKLVTLMSDSPAVIALPLYDNTVLPLAIQHPTVEGLTLSDRQKVKISGFCQTVDEPIAHFYTKLMMWKGSLDVLSDDDLDAFCDLYTPAAMLEGDSVEEPVGINRMQFAGFARNLRASPNLTGATLVAQASKALDFITRERLAMDHPILGGVLMAHRTVENE